MCNNNEELHCRLGCIEVIVLCRSISFSLQYYVCSLCLLQSVSSFHLIRHANNSPSTRCNLSSSSSLSFSWVVRTDSSLTHSSTASSSYGSGLSPTPNLLAAPPRGSALLHTCVSWPLSSCALPIRYIRKPGLHLLHVMPWSTTGAIHLWNPPR